MLKGAMWRYSSSVTNKRMLVGGQVKEVDDEDAAMWRAAEPIIRTVAASILRAKA